MVGDFSSQPLHFASAALAFDEFCFGPARATRLLAAEFCNRGEALPTSAFGLAFEQIEKPAERQMTILRLRAALRGGDGETGGTVTNRSRRADLVHVLASGTSRARKTLLKILRANPQ